METSLHRQLKQNYARCEADIEVAIGRYRVDAIRDDELIEIQCASLSALRDKSRQLLRRHRLRIVKPVIVRTRIRRLDRVDGQVLSRRMSPKRGAIVDVFDDLIYFTRLFPHPNLTIEVVSVEVEQTRVPNRKRRRRWHPDYRVQELTLERVVGQVEFREPRDLLSVIPWPDGPASFNTAELATLIDRPRWFAQKVAYVLRKTGAIEAQMRNRSGVQYQFRSAA
jgi:hypothetical protein